HRASDLLTGARRAFNSSPNPGSGAKDFPDFLDRSLSGVLTAGIILPAQQDSPTNTRASKLALKASHLSTSAATATHGYVTYPRAPRRSVLKTDSARSLPTRALPCETVQDHSGQ